MDKLEAARQAIITACLETQDFLLGKNAAYGNSVFDPVRLFSKASLVEQINVRIDDKISRLMRGHAAGEDVEDDLLGYLMIKKAVKHYLKLSEESKDPFA